MYLVIPSSRDPEKSPYQKPDAGKDEKSCNGIRPDCGRRQDNTEPDEDQEGSDKERRHVRASRLRALTLPGSLNEPEQFRTDQSEPEPDKEAGYQLIDEQSHAKADQDAGRDDESAIPVIFYRFCQSALLFNPLCISNFSTVFRFHGFHLMD